MQPRPLNPQLKQEIQTENEVFQQEKQREAWRGFIFYWYLVLGKLPECQNGKY